MTLLPDLQNSAIPILMRRMAIPATTGHGADDASGNGPKEKASESPKFCVFTRRQPLSLICRRLPRARKSLVNTIDHTPRHIRAFEVILSQRCCLVYLPAIEGL